MAELPTTSLRTSTESWIVAIDRDVFLLSERSRVTFDLKKAPWALPALRRWFYGEETYLSSDREANQWIILKYRQINTNLWSITAADWKCYATWWPLGKSNRGNFRRDGSKQTHVFRDESETEVNKPTCLWMKANKCLVRNPLFSINFAIIFISTVWNYQMNKILSPVIDYLPCWFQPHNFPPTELWSPLWMMSSCLQFEFDFRFRPPLSRYARKIGWEGLPQKIWFWRFQFH